MRCHATRIRSTGTLLLLLVAACTETPATQVLVTVEAGPLVRERSESFVVTVEGGANANNLSTRHRETYFPGDWGTVFVLTPLEQDATRVFRVTVRASAGPDGMGEFVAETRLLSGYIDEETRAYTLTLSDVCAGIECDAQRNETCVDGDCTTAYLAPTELMLIPDPGALDAGTDSPLDVDPGIDGRTPADAGSPDVGPSRDAAPARETGVGDATVPRDAGRDGASTDGNVSDGASTDGNVSDGASTDGNVSDGASTDGNIPDTTTGSDGSAMVEAGAAT